MVEMSGNHNENLPLKENGIAGEEAMETAIVKPRLKWTNYQKLHLAITLVLLAVCIALVGVYLIELGSRMDSNCKDKMAEKRVCETPECIAIAAQVLTYADQKVDPCESFYHYACSGWMNQRYIPDSKPSWDTFSDLNDANDKLLKKKLSSGEPDKNSPAEVQLYKLYSSCLNVTGIEAIGVKPIKDLIKSLGSMPAIDPTWNESSWDMIESLVNIHAIFAPIVYMETAAPLFDIRVVVDIKNSSKPIVKISQPTSVFLAASQGKIPPHELPYYNAMVQTIKMLGGKNSEEDAKDILDLEKEISKGSVSNSFYRDVQASRKKMTVKELNATTYEMDWIRYLRLALKETGIEVTGDTEVAVQPLVYLQKMAAVVGKTKRKTLANYFMWTLIKEMQDSLPSSITKLFFELEKALTGAKTEDPRWQRCLRKVESTMGMALGAILVREKFKDEDKKEVEIMIENIKNSFLSIVQNSDWMDEETKANTLKKAKALIGNIAYPSFIKDPKKLAEYYKGVSLMSSEYFKNKLQLKKMQKAKNVIKLKSKVDRQEWEFPPSLVNAFYDAGRNKMVFMAGILQSPFFSRNAPKPVNYGGIGMVMGHELSHGFDDQGRLFDEKGNLKSWWTKKSANAYKKREKCIKNQYSAYTLHDMKLNGNRTLGENIADNSGLETAFKAYKKWVQVNGPPKRLPGVNVTDDQLFFLASAQIWCSIERPVFTKYSILHGQHSPAIFRVRGTLSNSKEFAKAFNCPVGSPMNPEKKCSIW